MKTDSPPNVPPLKKQRSLRYDMNRAIGKWAERIEKDVRRFPSIALLNALNTISIAAMFSEQAHMDAPDGFGKKFRHLRNLVTKRPLIEGAAPAKADILFSHVDKLFVEMQMDMMARAHFLASAQPEKRGSIEAWFFSRSRDLIEPPLGGARQYRQLFIDRFSKFDKALTVKFFGLSCDECLKLLDAMDGLLTEQLKNLSILEDTAKSEMVSFHERFQRKEISFEEAVHRARSCHGALALSDAKHRIFFVSLAELVRRSGLANDSVARFFEYASVVPGQNNADYLLPTDKEHGKMFIRMDGDSFYVLDVSALYPDFYHMTEGLIDEIDPKTREKYHEWKGKVTPANVARSLASIFGAENLTENLYYALPDGEGGKDRWYEADILARFGNQILLCEVKSHELNRSIGDRVGPDRMKRDFETLQEGYGQCVRTHRYINSRQIPVEFYKAGHKDLLLSLDKPVSEVYYLVITANSFGALAGNCSELLKRDGAPLPVIMSEFDLATITPYIKTPELFLTYLRQRASLQGFLKTSDELEVAGVFVTQGSLDELIEIKEKGEVDMMILNPDTSFVFNGPMWERIPEVQSAVDTKKLITTTITAESLGLVKAKS
ncbi:MAG: hypothetical protein JNL82_08130 [Myxococcales bacterium]|nr:hypothetical protein [Myxococcales bacterium]